MIKFWFTHQTDVCIRPTHQLGNSAGGGDPHISV